MIIFSQQGKLFEFSSANLEQSLERFQEYTGPVERKRGSDYAALQASGTTEDSEDDDADGHGESGDGGGGGGGGGAGKSGKRGSTSVHSNLRGKEEWKNGSKPVVPTQGANKGKRQRTSIPKSTSSNRRSSSPYENNQAIVESTHGMGVLDRYSRVPEYVDGMESSSGVVGMRSGAGYQDGSRKRQRSVEEPYGHRQYSTEPSHSSTPPPQPPMHSLYGSSARANGNVHHQMEPSLVVPHPNTGVYIGQHHHHHHAPSSSSHANGTSSSSVPPTAAELGTPETYARYHDSSSNGAVWHSEGQMAMQIQARLQAEQAQLHEIRRQQAQNMEWQRRIQAAEGGGQAMGVPYPGGGRSGGGAAGGGGGGGGGDDDYDQMTMAQGQGPGMDAFLAQLLAGCGSNDQQQQQQLQAVAAHAQSLDPAAGVSIPSRQWQPTATPSSASSFEGSQPPPPQSVADYLAMLRAGGHQPPQPPPPSSSMMAHQHPRSSSSTAKPPSSYVTGMQNGIHGEDSVRMPTPPR